MDVQVFQEQLRRWRDLERAALAAEERVRHLGQMGQSPETAELCREASAKRRAADDYLSGLLGTTAPSERASNDSLSGTVQRGE